MKQLNIKEIEYRPISKGLHWKWEVSFNEEMDRIMYLAISNIFHIYKLMGLHSLKWSIATQNKDEDIINACILNTEVQCSTESRKMLMYWIILNSGILNVCKSFMALEWRRSSASMLLGMEICCVRQCVTFRALEKNLFEVY